MQIGSKDFPSKVSKQGQKLKAEKLEIGNEVYSTSFG